MILINDRVVLDETEFQFEFIRASGPGGQNVNKVSMAVRLRFDVTGSVSLPDDVRQRLIGLAGKKVGADGFLTLHARARRTQEANRRSHRSAGRTGPEGVRAAQITPGDLADTGIAETGGWRPSGIVARPRCLLVFAGITRGIRANGRIRIGEAACRSHELSSDQGTSPSSSTKHSKHNPD